MPFEHSHFRLFVFFIFLNLIQFPGHSQDKRENAWRVNYTASIFHNPNGNDRTKYRFESPLFYMTYFTEVAYCSGIFEVGAFLGRTRDLSKASGIFVGNSFLNYGFSALIIPREILRLNLKNNGKSSFQLYARGEIHGYHTLDDAGIEHNRLLGIGPGVRANITKKIAFGYEYIFLTYNENRFQINYFIGR